MQQKPSGSSHEGLPRTAESPSAATDSGQYRGPKWLLILVIVLVAINLRPALLGVGPLVDEIRGVLGLSSAAFGLLLTLPVLCFGAFAPFAPRLLRYWTAERLILVNMVVLIVGLVWRSAYGVIALFGGTLLIGLGISIVMVMLPSIIKHHFPRQASIMMGLYSTALALGAAVAAGITVPMSQGLGGWRWALGLWVLPAVVGLLAWGLYGPTPVRKAASTTASTVRLRSNWLAWQVTLYLGLQGAISYSIFGWLPLILMDRGLSERNAGYMLAGMMCVQLLSSIAGPWFAARRKDQRSTILFMVFFVLVGWLCFLYGDIRYMPLWSIVFGTGFGGVFSMAMALLVLRSPTASVAAGISGMAQGVGYTFAAAAPLIIGVLYDATGNWEMVSLFMIFLIVAAGWTGYLAGRDRYIE